MKFDLYINQKAIMENDFDLDVVDGAIMDFCLRFSASGASLSFVDKGIRYYWFEHENICLQLPILRLKADTIYRRMKGLCTKAFLLAHPNNKQRGQSYYALLPNAYLIESTIGKSSDGGTDENPMVLAGAGKQGIPSDENPKGTDTNPMVPSKSPEPSDFRPMPFGKSSDAPSDDFPIYKDIIVLGNNLLDTTSSATVSAGASKKNGDGFSAEDIAEFQQTLPAQEQPPKPPSSATPPNSPKKQYGDGALQKLARQYFRDHPHEFPEDMYPEFLDHWTEIVQNSEFERDIGKELWRTKPTFPVGKKLANWNVGYQRDQLKRNESATRQPQPAINGTHPASGPRTPKAAGTGTVKRTPVVTADKLRRNGPANGYRDPNSGRGATVIDVERGDYSVEDSV